MLMSLRQSVNKSFIKYLIFGVLILSFGLWGVADLFIPSDGANEVVMTAGDREFTYAEVEASYSRELRNLQLDRGSADNLVLQQVLEYVLDRFAVSAMNSQLIEELQIKGDKSSVFALIANNRAFYDAFGRFDARQFQRFLGISGLSEGEYTDLLAQDIGAQYWLGGLQASIAVPKSLSTAYGDYLRRLNEIAFVEIPYSSVSQADPTDGELRSYYSANMESYRIDEERKFLLVDISVSSLAGELTPSEDEIRTRYDEGSYSFEQPEKRDISFIIFADSVKAETAYESAGESSLQQIASANDLAVQEIASQARVSIADEAIGEQAFGLAEVGDRALFEGAFGWVLLQLDGIEAAQVATYESVKDTIVADILTERTSDLIYTKAQALEDAVSTGADLVESARLAGLEVLEYSSFDGLGSDIISEAFLLGENEISTLIERQGEGSGGFFMLQLDSITDSHIADFADVEADVRADILREKRQQALQASQASVKDLSTFATLWGGSIRTATVGLSPSDDYPRELNAVEFRQNDVGYRQAFAGEDSFILAELQSVSLREVEAGQEDIGDRIFQRLMQNMVTQAYESSLRKKYKVTRNEEALRNIILGDISGG